MSLSKVRQNYHEECEGLINKQINMELYASYVYLSMSCYFERDDLALHGFAKFFADNSSEETGHAKKFMAYQNSRGGRVIFKDISQPNNTEWGSALDAMEAALELEKTVNQSLLDLTGVAAKHCDRHLEDFLASTFLTEQVDAIKGLAAWITKMKRAGDGVGLHVMDKEIAQ